MSGVVGRREKRKRCEGEGEKAGGKPEKRSDKGKRKEEEEEEGGVGEEEGGRHTTSRVGGSLIGRTVIGAMATFDRAP